MFLWPVFNQIWLKPFYFTACKSKLKTKSDKYISYNSLTISDTTVSSHIKPWVLHEKKCCEDVEALLYY